MASSCPSCGGPLLGASTSGFLDAACPACLSALLLGEPPGLTEEVVAPAALLGGHRLVREIARGGMGAVWVAERASDGSRVALKLLPPALAADPSRLARFRAEATLAARLVHPGIVAIRDMGEHDGVPFYTMDLVEGPDLGVVAAGLPMPAREAARLVRAVALAVHFAHGQGVLHRDIKPTNVLLGADGKPRIADFGLARLLDMDARLTATGEAMGSPSFMAPEQVAGEAGASGVRTDVHGLGGLLYFCLTGRAPFAAESVAAALAKAMASRPVPPREWEPAVPVALEAITMRCLARQASDRYPSALALAEDLERVLTGERVHASGGGWGGWGGGAWRWPGGGVAWLLAGVVLAGVGGWMAWTRERGEAARARRAGDEARALARYALDVGRAGQAHAAGDGEAALGLLEALIPPVGVPDCRGIEWYVLRRRVADREGAVRPAQGPRPSEWMTWAGWPEGEALGGLAFTAEGGWLVAGHGAAEGAITRAWRVARPGEEPARFRGLPAGLDPRGGCILTTLPGGSLGLHRLPDGAWIGGTGSPVGDGVDRWEMSADGAFLAGIGSGDRLWLVHVGSGQALPGPSGPARAFRLSPDGNGVLVATSSGAEWLALRPRRQARVATGEVSALAWDGTGARAGIGRGDGWVEVLEALGDRGVARWRAHEGRVTAMAFARDGRTLLTGGADGWVRFWNTTLWREVHGMRVASGVERVEAVEASPDGQCLALVAGGRLHVLDTTGAGPGPEVLPARAAFWEAPSGALQALGSRGPRPGAGGAGLDGAGTIPLGR